MYRQEFYLYADGKPVKAIIRNYREADFDELIQIQAESFPPPYPSEQWWNREQLTNHITLFPEGALCIEVAGKLAGSVTGMLMRFNPDDAGHSWETTTDGGYIRTHDPNGDTLYIVDICVRPAYRKLNLGKALMQAMYNVVVHMGLKRLLGGGRMPGYHRQAAAMTPEEYLDAVVRGEVFDPVISFLLRCGRMPLKVVPDYLPDEESHNYAVLMEWQNPFKT